MRSKNNGLARLADQYMSPAKAASKSVLRPAPRAPISAKSVAVAAATVDGWTINLATMDSAISALIGAASSRQSFTCLTLNLDHLVKLRRQERFRHAYRTARFVTADGAPVAALAQRQWPQLERTAGSDMIIPLSIAAAANDIPIYLFGTSEDVLVDASAELRRRCNGKLVIAGMESPPQGFDVEGAGADAAIERIRQSGAGLCFVLLGAPKQELFATRAIEAGVPCGFICAGAAADFIVGRQVRAPGFMQAIGMEWMWRLAGNPYRLGARYARCALLLASIVGSEVTRSLRSSTARP